MTTSDRNRSSSINIPRVDDAGATLLHPADVQKSEDSAAGRSPPKPTDHWYGIVVAVCVFLGQVGIYGVSNSFSVFAHQITQDASIGKPSDTEVSFGSSLSNGVGPVVSIFAGALTDRLGPRIVLMAAAILSSVAYFGSSFASTVSIFVLAYSLPMCVGMACLSTPGSAAVSSWLDKRLSLGMGIAYSGNGAGSSIIVPIAGILADRMSWRSSFKLMAAFPLISLVAAVFVYFRVKPEPRKPLSREEREFLKNLFTCRAFYVLLTCSILFSYTFFSTLYIIVPFAASYGAAGSYYGDLERIKIPLAATLFTWFGVFKWIGSLMLGWVAHRTETRIVYSISAGLVGLLCFLWPLCTTYTQLAAVCSGLGFTFAGMFATLPSMTAACFRGKFAGLAIGITMAGFLVGGFAGAPVTLAIKESQGGVYTLSFALMGCTTVLSGLICMIAGEGFLHHQPFAADFAEEVVASSASQSQ